MTRSLSRWRAVLLGVVVLVALGLATAGLLAVGSRTWFRGDTFHVRSGFKSIQGVEVGTRVRIQGIDAGEVISMELPTSPGGDVILRLRLNGGLRHLVRRDAMVQIASEGLIGGKTLEIHPGSATSDPVADDGLLASRSATEIGDVLEEVRDTVQKLRDGEGALGKEVVTTLQQMRSTFKSIEGRSEALGNVPLVGRYLQDARKILIRPNCECLERFFPEAELFEPSRSSLTAHGKQRLDRVVPELKGSLKHTGADLVVVSLADPQSPDPARARALCDAQCQAVCDYLKEKHSVQKAGLVTWRTVTPLGLGSDPSPRPSQASTPPPPRVELLVFIPQK